MLFYQLVHIYPPPKKKQQINKNKSVVKTLSHSQWEGTPGSMGSGALRACCISNIALNLKIYKKRANIGEASGSLKLGQKTQRGSNL